MTSLPPIPIWKEAPLIRLIIPFASGICWQWYSDSSWSLSIMLFAIGLLLLMLPGFFGRYLRYRTAALTGLASFLLLFSFGSARTWLQDVRNDPRSFQRHATPLFTSATIEEPPSIRPRSIKAVARVNFLGDSLHRARRVNGGIIIYFATDSSAPVPQLGQTVYFRKLTQPIPSASNPGGFDFKRYALFQGITATVYLTRGEYSLSHSARPSFLSKLLLHSRDWILRVIRKNLSLSQHGLAEALLIGYKDDLDKELVQSYSNTGVVHIIAISGLHLGLIFWILTRIFAPLQRLRPLRWLRLIAIVAILWLFSLMAGGQPSVVRSALMLSCIVLGQFINRRSSIYNNLALSAFLLLVYDPFWLWDVGFQLSYSALLSIVMFQRPIYDAIIFRNPFIDGIWKLAAVTLAAQILTMPLCIFYFHQFPNYFLLTNLVAVPLSSGILLGEILLCAIPFDMPAHWLGDLVSGAIHIMNAFIQQMERLPFALWTHLNISWLQTIVLYFLIGGITIAIRRRSMVAVRITLTALLLFSILRLRSFITTYEQRRLLVYNIPRGSYLQLIDGRRAYCIGALTPLQQNGLAPSEAGLRINFHATIDSSSRNVLLNFAGRRILLCRQPMRLKAAVHPMTIDLLVFSGNGYFDLRSMFAAIRIRQVVFDATVPPKKSIALIQVCDSLHIPVYDVNAKGAFVMNCP